MKDTPVISVLMSVFNTDFFLVKRAIDSVLLQDFFDFELIIIDDGSHNDVKNQLFNYIKKHENKITYLWHANRGQSESVNRGVILSKGKYITILDADDEYQPNHLSSCLKEISAIDLIASATHTIVEKEEDYYVPDKKNNNQLIHVDDCILFATLFGKRNVFLDIKFEGQYAADANFFEAASKKYLVKKVNLRTYTYYRNNPDSVVARLKVKNKLH
ncbi:MAG: glycosyltransferase family 2 protein [Bacteroidetes bacterium HGW-Bacteroidetes-2]|jgi:glycosyltransferase involved in cell wall biosynthesis|nr:MAG: glycosyltransferase family 2 protein [Bacteroidetes bacterium HGW-Bacteroidetes-2]